MNSIKTSNYRSQIKGLISEYTSARFSIKIVPSIQEWCNNNTPYKEDDPFRAAIVIKNRRTGEFIILLAEVITDNMVNSIKGRSMIAGFLDEVDSLKTDWDFLKHTALHELAHVLHEDLSEEDCDKWAFKEMGITSN